MTLAATNRDGKPIELDMKLVDALRASLRGTLHTPGAPGYDESRTLWNGMIDRRPALVARCEGTSDVVACVRFAREHGIALSIKGGGHNIAGLACCDGGLMLDFCGMRGVWVDPGARVAHAQGGCLLGDVDRETQLHGLAAPLGFVSLTGVAGLTLGGGIGYTSRRFGWTSDSVRSMTIVTADGRIVRASEEENPELFWALRGGGGNFGVVTSFEFQLHRIGPLVQAGMLAWPMGDAVKVLQFLRDFTATAPDEVGLMANLRLAPPLPVVPEELHGTPIVALVATYAGPVDEGAAALAALDELPPPVVDTVGAKPYVAHQKLFNPAVPHGWHYYWRSHKLGHLTDDVIDIVVENAERITSPQTTVPIFTLGGAVARVPDDATAVANRQATHDINITAAWLPDDPDSDRHIEWVRDFFGALEPHSRGVYVNFTSDDTAGRISTAAYTSVQWERLVAVKTTLDPANVFHHNANIPPRSPGT